MRQLVAALVVTVVQLVARVVVVVCWLGFVVVVYRPGCRGSSAVPLVVDLLSLGVVKGLPRGLVPVTTAAVLVNLVLAMWAPVE